MFELKMDRDMGKEGFLSMLNVDIERVADLLLRTTVEPKTKSKCLLAIFDDMDSTLNEKVVATYFFGALDEDKIMREAMKLILIKKWVEEDK